MVYGTITLVAELVAAKTWLCRGECWLRSVRSVRMVGKDTCSLAAILIRASADHPHRPRQQLPLRGDFNCDLSLHHGQSTMLSTVLGECLT